MGLCATMPEVTQFIVEVRKSGATKIQLFGITVDYPHAVAVPLQSTQAREVSAHPTGGPAQAAAKAPISPPPVGIYQQYLDKVVQPNIAGMSEHDKALASVQAKILQQQQEAEERRNYERIMYHSSDEGTI